MLRLNKFIASHMTGNNSPGIFTCGAPDRGGLDGLIDKFTNSGAIHHSFKSYVNTTFVIPGYAEMTIGVEYLNVSGLDTLTNLTVLEPTGAHSLTTGIAAKAFNASVGIVLEIDPIEGGVMQVRVISRDENHGNYTHPSSPFGDSLPLIAGYFTKGALRPRS